MYPTSGQLLLGFHGCDQATGEAVISGGARLRPSTNVWDWLGHGIYFWESDPQRALEFAFILKDRVKSSIKKPFVVGSVLDLGKCLNLLNRSHLVLVKRAYEGMKKAMVLKGERLPVNKRAGGSEDLLLRNLDCAVINYLHQAMVAMKEKPFYSVRAAFWEGEDLYPDAGFRELSHIQICVRNPNCIKGYFYPLDPITSHPEV